MTHATAGINLEDITLSEMNQFQEDNCCTVPRKRVSKVIKFIDTQGRMAVTKGWGRRKREEAFVSTEFPFRKR